MRIFKLGSLLNQKFKAKNATALGQSLTLKVKPFRELSNGPRRINIRVVER